MRRSGVSRLCHRQDGAVASNRATRRLLTDRLVFLTATCPSLHHLIGCRTGSGNPVRQATSQAYHALAVMCITFMFGHRIYMSFSHRRRWYGVGGQCGGAGEVGAWWFVGAFTAGWSSARFGWRRVRSSTTVPTEPFPARPSSGESETRPGLGAPPASALVRVGPAGGTDGRVRPCPGCRWESLRTGSRSVDRTAPHPLSAPHRGRRGPRARRLTSIFHRLVGWGWAASLPVLRG